MAFHKIEQIIDYYEPEEYLMDGKVVSLEEYRRKMNLE